ncbi:MAG: pyridoxine 5'-phosphate synthase [Phycisphaeraceae bacterium]|nr:pyridoxine 5'-phosphate synthase [Phycisphaerae bacterium]MBX3392277.1 pyridoxine 5'-phosphate synthase [Phycisphaeraceae bacterium]
MPLLGVNIDHVATLRQARRGSEPDPVRAAHEAELGGADIITIHLREDRRHIQDRDADRLKAFVAARLNLEMAATDEMVKFARRLGPHMCTLVPEGRREVTTEGGLDVAKDLARLRGVVRRLRDSGIVVSAFIDADERQVESALNAGFDACELHTGPYAAAFASAGGDFSRPKLWESFDIVRGAGALIRSRSMRFNAGHALNYLNVGPIAGLPGVAELHIGHAIVSRAVFTGLRQAVADMKAAMSSATHGTELPA